MSLQGTLDTFALPEVLRLLASTAKTGRLTLDGDRGVGHVWIDGGALVAGDTERTTAQAPLAEVVFELLRFERGGFEFHADESTEDAGAPVEVEPLLVEAEALLADWQAIAAVVPSMSAAVWLEAELTQPSVQVDAAQWRLLAAIGSGATVASVADRFGLGELAGSRAVKELVERGLVRISDRPAPNEVPSSAPPVEWPPPVHAASTAATSAASAAEVETPALAVVRPLSADLVEAAALAAAAADAAEHQLDEPMADEPVAGPELARQLAALGPEAARAVAAAAQADTPEARDAALASIADELDGIPISRGLLLKFLSSVRT